MNLFLIHTSYSTVQSVIWQMSYEILKFLLFISRDKMIKANKYFLNYIGKLWWYKCPAWSMLLHQEEIHSRQHLDLSNFRHFVPDWSTYSNQPKETFDRFWRSWQNWKDSTMITLIHLIYFEVLFIGHFFNLKFWMNLGSLTCVMYKFFSQTCILVFLWWQKVKKTCISTSIMFHCNVKCLELKNIR